ncbi:DinB family protein [Pedobacter sandarakinus]|uniref:DinB family protein n=1 Tax=Pedobacter sandarakinus TaxID=353156 RepID=UPI0022471AB4|nr:DinB family protein [Pedobacter sandarakinus]MCX2576346.1 DinB family protein [Pedobacter sandarakinus]
MSLVDLLLKEMNEMEKTKKQHMDIIKALLTELESEFNITKKFLSLVPTNQFDWAPHARSMKMKALASHIAELPEWIELAFQTDGLDFATAPYEEKSVTSQEDLLHILETSYAKGKAALENANEGVLGKQWILRNGDQVLGDMNKYEMIRIAFSQTIHHRAQLGVYLRLLDIPIPGSYGPSADDQSF